MTTVCPGWMPHLHSRPILLKDNGHDDGRVSHGMCEACIQATNNALDIIEDQVATDRRNGAPGLRSGAARRC
jgi:hypothetical protein